MAKVPHFWISESMADAFATWLQSQPEITSQTPMQGEFTPERYRMTFRSRNLGFEQTFMMYDNAKYTCVNVPRNAIGALMAYCAEIGSQMPSGTLGTARGDGKDDTAVAAARAAAAAAAKVAKEDAAAAAAAAPATTNTDTGSQPEPKVKAKKGK